MSTVSKETWQVIPITKQMGQTTNVVVQTDTTSSEGKTGVSITQNVNQIQENQKFDTANQIEVKSLNGGGSKKSQQYMLFYKDKSWLYQKKSDKGMNQTDLEMSIVKDFMEKKNKKTEYLLKIRNIKKQKDTFYVVRPTQHHRIRKLYD
jgi:hypothetical protein